MIIINNINMDLEINLNDKNKKDNPHNTKSSNKPNFCLVNLS